MSQHSSLSHPTDRALPRRRFLTTAASSVATLPAWFSLASQAAGEIASSNDRPTIGVIGLGRMGHNHMRFAKGMCDVTAVCDVDTEHRERAHKNLTGGQGDAYNDYRKVLERDDIDVVYIATPDHWHAKILIEAMRSGKDAYCEKPLTLTIDEGRKIQRVMAETGKIVQVGTMQRSYLDLFVKAVAMAGDGRLGQIRRVTATIGGSNGSQPIPQTKPMTGLDWNMWLGPAPEAPFRLSPKQPDDNEWTIGETNAHQKFRWWLDYSGGIMTDWGAHHVDIALWALREAGQSDTLKTIGGDYQWLVPYENGYPTQTDRYHTLKSFSITATMTDGGEVVINSKGRNGVLIEGTKGRIFVNRGALQGKPVEQLAENPLPEDAIAKTYRGFPTPWNRHQNHWANFFHCVRERQQPISDVDSHLRAINICHLANIMARVDRPLTWDETNGSVVGDDLANSLFAREYRKGFEIEG